MSKKVREMTQFDVGSGGVSSNPEGDAIRNAYAKGVAAEREKSGNTTNGRLSNGTTTNGRLSNTDALGEYKAPTWNGGTGAGSRSTMENLAKDIYDSSYSKFTEGEDYASLVKRYSAQGRQAMDDTVGQMAARTGGLASSWAASAGQQAYGGWMEKLEDAARSLYDSEFAKKMNKLGVAQGLYDRDYSEFQDNRNFNYGVHRDAVSDAQWADNMDFQQRRAEASDAQWKDKFEYQQNQDTKEEAENFKDSIYDAAYWGGDASWAEFAKKAKGYNITEAEFNRIVASAEGARGDDAFDKYQSSGAITATAINKGMGQLTQTEKDNFDYYYGSGAADSLETLETTLKKYEFDYSEVYDGTDEAATAEASNSGLAVVSLQKIEQLFDDLIRAYPTLGENYATLDTFFAKVAPNLSEKVWDMMGESDEEE